MKPPWGDRPTRGGLKTVLNPRVGDSLHSACGFKPPRVGRFPHGGFPIPHAECNDAPI